MARRGVSEAQKRSSAIQAGRRLIARGNRPMYRLRFISDAGWAAEFPGVQLSASTRREAFDEARSAIAAILEVDPSLFDIEV